METLQAPWMKNKFALKREILGLSVDDLERWKIRLEILLHLLRCRLYSLRQRKNSSSCNVAPVFTEIVQGNLIHAVRVGYDAAKEWVKNHMYSII